MKKKKSSKNRLRYAFWAVFIAGCLFVALVPPHHAPQPPRSITVKVTPPPEPIAPESSDEEQTAPPPMPIPKPEVPPAASIVVPVTPPAPPPVAVGHHPTIAIVIDDVGIDLRGSERATRLPSFITLSFLPYAARLRDQTHAARDAGHELLLHMPMEPLGYEDPGPGALLVDLPMRDLQQRFETALASFTGFDGVNNHMGSKFTAYPDGMSMVVDELQQRHLFYLDSRTSAASVGKKIAEEKGLPTIGRDVFLDDDQSPDAIRAQLQTTERVAERNGAAVAIGHPHAATLDVLEAWIPEAQKRGFDLVPINRLVTGQPPE